MNVDHQTKMITFHWDNYVFIPTTNSKYKKVNGLLDGGGLYFKDFNRHNPIIKYINAEVVMVPKKSN